VQRALLATVFLSQGTPMLLGGDEFGRTQTAATTTPIARTTRSRGSTGSRPRREEGRKPRRLRGADRRLRHATRCCASRRFLHGKDEVAPGIRDIAWFDTPAKSSPTNPGTTRRKRLLLRRAGRNGDGSVRS
jgi:isoamylase